MHNATFTDARACFNLNRAQRDETKCAENANPLLILICCLGTLLLLQNHLVGCAAGLILTSSDLLFIPTYITKAFDAFVGGGGAISTI